MANTAKVKSHLSRRFCNEIEIVALSNRVYNGAPGKNVAEKAMPGVYKHHRVFLCRSHIVRDRIRKDVMTHHPVTVHVDREAVFFMREDVLRARYNLDGVNLPR